MGAPVSFLLFVVLSGLAAAGEAEAPPARPNVLFVFDDQLRADACSVYGGVNIETPHIDRLAAEGMRFTNALSTYPLCTPYRAMLQTGRYPTHSGSIMNFTEVNPDQRCIAHVFADAGYDTGFIGKWHLAAGWRKHEGLLEPDRGRVRAYREEHPETEFVPPGPARLGYQHWEAFNFHCSFNRYWYYRDEPVKVRSKRYETDAQIDQAIAYMEAHRETGRPFFLMVAPHPPHPPFGKPHLPAGYLEQIPEEIQHPPNVPADHPRRRDPAGVRGYLAMCKNMDDNLGRLLHYLDDSGLAGSTIVVFTSDHGEQHGSHGRVNKMVPYAESVDLPLLVRWPGRIEAGAVDDTLVTPMDHLPTLCGLVGLEAPPAIDGLDLSPVLRGEGIVERDAVLLMTCTSHWDFLQTQTHWPEWRGVRTKRHTYCAWLDGEEELYDNEQDPHQMTNLAGDEAAAELLARMRATLQRLLGEAHDELRPGTEYADWFDEERNIIRTGLGPVR
jgi:arylsulfatase A-like enzyme